MSDLPSDQMATLVQIANMYYKDNLSQQEIANQLGVSRSLIATYLQRARSAFGPHRDCGSSRRFGASGY